MRYPIRLFFFILFPFLTNAQQQGLDSLKNIFLNATDDSVRFGTATRIYAYYEELNRDSALYYTDQCIQLARRNKKKMNEVPSLCQKAYQLLNMGQFAESLESLFTAFNIAEDPQNEKYYWTFDSLHWIFDKHTSESNRRLSGLAYTHHISGVLMWRTQNTEREIFHFRMAKSIGDDINNVTRSQLADMNLGRAYTNINKLDSALIFEKEAQRLAWKSGYLKYLPFNLYQQGLIYLRMKDTVTATHYFHGSVKLGIELSNLSALGRSYYELTKIYIEKNNKDSSLYYGQKTLNTLYTLGPMAGIDLNIGIAYENMFHVYKLRNEVDSAYKYQGLALEANDSIYNNRIKNLAAFQSLTLKEQFRLQNVEKEKVVYQNKIRIYFLLAGIGMLLLLAIIFYRNNRQKNKAKIKIEQAYDNLKATQQQLIQSEKMASLGELTAGIAHEIQNPLNFVNNFSDVNRELVDEMQQELKAGKIEDAITISNDIKENEEKINHHGKRADLIVKGMLQHSRTSSGQKEPTDINILADEYLRLAYHGLRAKDKSFKADIKTDFDNSVGKINIIPQEIGRVILNLINNAFYAVDEKKKLHQNGYEPIVSLSTKKNNGKVEIKVSDNGNGIPEKVVDKIFQPFFTTKPTGQGTGLGLSLSYDIVRAHGGEIQITTKENEGSDFRILLPLNNAS